MSITTSSPSVCTVEPAFGEQRQAADLWLRPLAAVALTAIISVIVLRSTPVSMVKIWYDSSTYSYGFIVVPIFVFLVWRCRNRLRVVQPTTSVFGLALVLLFALIWMVGNIADVQLIEQFAFIGLLDALVWAFLGRAAARVLALPLLFLFFAVPAGESLVGPLQRLTAMFTVNAVRLSGIPVVQDGLVISTPSGDWRIAEACSGIRYLTSSILIGVLFAGVAFRSWKRRIAFVVISAIVPILANAIRAYLILVLAYLSNNRIAAGVDHVVYGWLFFSLVTAAMIGIALGWREPEISRVRSAPTITSQSPAAGREKRLLWSTVIAVFIVISASSTASFLWSRTPPNQPIEQLWSAPSDWLPTADPDHDWAPHFGNVESESAQTFTSGTREVSLYVASYPVKERGVELVTSSNEVGSGEWTVVNNGYHDVAMAGRRVRIAEYQMVLGGQHRVMWMWYLVGGHPTSSHYLVKTLAAESRLAGQPQDVSLFAVSAKVGYEPAQAIRDLGTFVQGLSFSERGKVAQ